MDFYDLNWKIKIVKEHLGLLTESSLLKDVIWSSAQNKFNIFTTRISVTIQIQASNTFAVFKYLAKY